MAGKKGVIEKQSVIEKLKIWIQENKLLSFFIAVVIVAIVLMFGTKIYLLLNFVLGNDIAAQLETSKEELFLHRGEGEEIVFKAKVIANPFCKVECRLLFEDISKNKSIEQSLVGIRPGNPFTRKYNISIEQLGEGIELYRFSIECTSIKTMLCHTRGKPTSRSVLVTAEYSLSEEEKNLKNELKKDLTNTKNSLEGIYSKVALSEEIIKNLENQIFLNSAEAGIIDSKRILKESINEVTGLQETWNNQNYYLLEDEFKKFNNSFQGAYEKALNASNIVLDSALRYNYIIEQLNKTYQKLDELRIMLFLNAEQIIEINNAVREFNSKAETLEEKSTLSKKEKETESIANITSGLYAKIKENARKNAINKSIETDINYGIMCKLGQICISRPSISERAYQKSFDLNTACSDIEKLKDTYRNINGTLAYGDFTDTDEFWNGIKLKLMGIRQSINEEYIRELDMLPENATNREYIKNLLLMKNFEGADKNYDTSEVNAILAELIKEQPESCVTSNINLSDLKKAGIQKVEIKENVSFRINIEFEEHYPQCCVFGKCEKCFNDPAKLPVVFLHGYAFNKDVTADYSLDAFNKMQAELEKDGYLNAGAISLYTSKDEKPGLWSQIGAPISIKASYYFDFLQETEDYIQVQTKSENIDTYAIRLKEIIDDIGFRTGKPKTILIAHSMGGLVARRYLQIFGAEKVEKLIMIGTPNNGISGSIAEYCPVKGGSLECRDMNEGSLFINKLNREKMPNIGIYNIVGTGCKMRGMDGDGIVLESSAWLDGAENFLVNGTCKGADLVHKDLLDVEKYPEVSAFIKKALSSG